jgi:2-phosphoglycerate kinase
MSETLPILIGGAPGNGKSFVAEMLSKKLGISWISTDLLRDLMIGVVRKEDYPDLFNAEDITPEDYYSKYTSLEIVDNSNKISKETYKIIQCFINKNFTWKQYIIEGIAITPEFVIEVLQDNPQTKYVFLIDTNKDSIRNLVYTRGVWDDAEKYSDSVKDKEVEWIYEYNIWLKDECIKNNLKYIEISDRSMVFDEAFKFISS